MQIGWNTPFGGLMTKQPKVFSHVGIDSDILSYSCSFAAQEGSLSDLKSAVDDMVNYICENTVVFPDFSDDGNVSGYLTGQGNFRNEVAKTHVYKGTRKEVEKPKWLQYARAYMVDQYNFKVIDGMEADDQLAIDMTNYHDPDAYVIASIDKDLLTVPGWHYNFRKNTFQYQTEHDALRFFYEQCLTGDRVDSVVGLHRVGPKTAQKVLDSALTEHEMFARVLKMYEEKCTDGDPYDRLIENATLLHMRRYENEMWEPPK